MWEINKAVTDDDRHTGKSQIQLIAATTLNPYTIAYPFLWEGRINGENVVIKQLNQSAITKDDFEFEPFPRKYEHLQLSIIRLIHDKLNTLN